MKIRVLFITLLILILFLSTVAMGEGYLKNIEVYFEQIGIQIDNRDISFRDDIFIYQDRIYAPVRSMVEAMGGQVVSWDNSTSTAVLNSYIDINECDYLNGETFVYGMIKSIDYSNKEIEIEQHFDDNSIEVTPILKVRTDAVILLQRNDKKVNINFTDLNHGEDIGLILDKNNIVRGIIVTV